MAQVKIKIPTQLRSATGGEGTVQAEGGLSGRCWSTCSRPTPSCGTA